MDSRNVSSTPRREGPNPEDYDLVILGGGTGSTIAAWTFASEGQHVAVIDRKYIGGSCPNIACLPSKNVVHSAKIASYFRRAEEFGLPKQDFAVRMPVVRERKRKMVSGLNQMYMDNYKKTGAEFILGYGRFVAPKTVQVTLDDGTTRVLRGKNVIICTGTHAALDTVTGLAEANPLTHIEALELDQLPEHLLVIGGGYVGLEFAQAMRRFGSKVTVIERNKRVIHNEDDDVTEILQELFEDEGIEVILNAQIQQISGRSGQSISAVVEKEGVTKTLEGTHLLVATGRVPNTANIGLELAGIELNDRGYIKTNEHLHTTAPEVWAIGEVAGSPQFTHVSVDDFRVVHDSIHGGKRVTTGRQVPFCLFTDPEFARIGLSEKEARANGTLYRLFKIPMEEVLRARTLSETRGFLKALVATDSDRILGFSALAPDAGEIMSAVQIAMAAGVPYTALRDGLFAHPTLVEGLIPLFSAAASPPMATEADAIAARDTKRAAASHRR
jgi:pyruvate/2-oxoglutarate dehydrogenase complex dihydrolipoamide dehydrogenase (E3) component